MEITKQVCSIIISICVILQNGGQSEAARVDGSRFNSVLDDIANNKLKVSEVQAYYDSLAYSSDLVNGQQLVQTISSSLSSKIDRAIQNLQSLKTAVEQEVGNFQGSTSLVECCYATGTTYNERFQGMVNINDACATTAATSPGSRVYPSQNIVNLMKDNYASNVDLTLQYLGTEDGVQLNYPSYRTSTCTDYDPRFRPFYVAAATPVEKDVVIVIDRSWPMAAVHGAKTLFQFAQEAAITVLHTLNPNDRVALVTFDLGASVPGSSERPCVGSKLSDATPQNVKYFSGEINKITVGSNANYEAALRAAFLFFKNSNTSRNNERRGQVILFLAAGESTRGDDPLDTIATLNGELNNRVTILTYGLGQSLSSGALTVLREMANQSRSNASYGDIQRGVFTHVSDPSTIRSVMGLYYTHLSSAGQVKDPVLSPPYLDTFRSGLVSSLCLPVNKADSSLYGVVCCDVSLGRLLSDVTYYREGESSYAFIIDGQGRTLMHPLLPYPSSYTEDPLYVYIEQLERDTGANDVIQSMMQGQSGDKTFTSTMTVSRGNVLTDGVQSSTMLSTYYWGMVQRSNYSLCVVVANGNQQLLLGAIPYNRESFTSHRLDLESEDGGEKCRHFNRYARKDTSVVMLTPPAFTSPLDYQSLQNTTSGLNALKDYLTGLTPANPGLQDSVLGSVTTSYQAESLWGTNPDVDQVMIWRYMGTTDGVMRIYPGVQLPQNYDHTRCPWYKRTLANTGKTVITPPYLDAFGSGYLITLSKAITQTGTSQSKKSTVAVMGADFTMSYLYQLVRNTYSNCRNEDYRCFLMDDSGFIVVHLDFVEPVTSTIEIEDVHITYKEPAIAEDMISINSMTKTNCDDLVHMKQQYSYRVNIPGGGLNRMGSPAMYEVSTIHNTNIYIIIKKNVYFSNQPSCCHSYGLSPDQLTCTNTDCDCLCHTDAAFDHCSNRYTLLSNTGQTCTPRVPALETQSISEGKQLSSLQDTCFNSDCKGKKSKEDCYRTIGCSWCMRDSDLDMLDSPYCTSQDVCYFGIEGRCPDGVNNNCTDSENRGEGGGEEEGPNLAALIGVPIAIFVICCLCSNKNRGPNRSKAPAATPAPAPPPATPAPATPAPHPSPPPAEEPISTPAQPDPPLERSNSTPAQLNTTSCTQTNVLPETFTHPASNNTGTGTINQAFSDIFVMDYLPSPSAPPPSYEEAVSQYYPGWKEEEEGEKSVVETKDIDFEI